MDIFWIVLAIILGIGVAVIIALGISCFIMGGNCSKYEDAAYYASLAQKRNEKQKQNQNEKNTIEKGKEDNGSCNDWK